MTDSKSLRESYLKFFESKAHMRLPSASLIPKDDPSLLLIGAGMAPFKPMFKGDVLPPHPRITTCQKCVRADDIDHVGRTSRHHTFFEMLGNFSFADYFKAETCSWAWEYLLQVLKLPQERLWVTIHPDDDEAFAIWTETIGVEPHRVLRLADNFWGPIGATGPCGPCSELIYDRGEQWGCGKSDCRPGCDCDRYLELWNLVFTGLYKDEQGNFTELPGKCIDTGLGLERLVMLMQEQTSPFSTDLFIPLMRAIEVLCGKKLDDRGDTAVNMKIIADHVRAIVFMAADGIFPSNEGRGYVFRRLLRRCVRLGRKLGMPDDFMVLLIKPVQEIMGDIYPEIKTKDLYIRNLVFQEEKNFQRTLEQGMNLLESLLAHHKQQGETMLSGAEVFKLHDTYGFPLELTREMAEEQGFALDEAGFNREMQEQKNRSEGKIFEDKSSLAYQLEVKTDFNGYDHLSGTAEVLRLFKDDVEVAELHSGEQGIAVLNLTPFYAASGGQVGDTGRLFAQGFEAEVLDTIKDAKETILHKLKVEMGTLKAGAFVSAQVDAARRLAICRHHTATHLLHKALREVVGTHITQAGSLVEPAKLRFDFTHFAALSKEQLKAVEDEVNKVILENYKVHTQVLPLQQALKSGAMALFDEKYGDTVRLLSVEDYSKELCGGTHLSCTAQAGGFKILSESAIGSGLRRIEAVCGFELLKHFRAENEVLQLVKQELKASSDEIPEALGKLQARLAKTEKHFKDLQAELARYKAGELLQQAVSLGDTKLIAAVLPDTGMDNLRVLGDLLKANIGSGIILLGSSFETKAVLVAMVTPDIIARGLKAGDLVARMAPMVGGKGGGKPDFAQAGGKEVSGLDKALAAGSTLAREKLALA